MFAIWDTNTDTLFDGPWHRWPKLIHHAKKISLSGAQAFVGHEVNGYRLVNATIVKNPPSVWHERSGVTYDLVGDELTITEIYARPTGKGPTADHVKLEAENRILNKYPLTKQMNAYSDFMLMREHLAGGGSLTAKQQTRYNAIKNAWSWVQSVRDASDTIEALDPIPDDYNDDARWPA